MTEQLSLLDAPARPPRPDRRPTTYWENRGPRDWRPVDLVTRYGKSSGLEEPPFQHVRTGRLGPRNVAIARADGHVRVVPVRTLRRHKPEPRR